MRRALLVALVVIAGFVVSGCTAASEPPPPADVVRTDAADAMLAVTSAHFTIERDGAPLRISGLVFSSATGDFAAPDSARAVLEVAAGDITARLGTVAIAERVWLTDPITGRWNELDAGTGFNPAIVFDPDIGWSAILRDDMADVTVTAVGADRLELRGVVSAARVATLTAGLATPQPTELLVRVDRTTSRIIDVEFDTAGPEGTSSWSIRLDDYDVPVTVEAPIG